MEVGGDTLAVVVVGKRRLRVTRHAAARYRERVGSYRFPTDESAAADLARVGTACGRIVEAWPRWARVEDEGHTGVLVIGDDIALPISSLGGLRTCVVRGCLPDTVRAYRSNRRRALSRNRKLMREVSDETGTRSGAGRRKNKRPETRRAELWVS